jgi:hypothetical protein
MELREIDAVQVATGGLVNDPNTHLGRTPSLGRRISSIDASNNGRVFVLALEGYRGLSVASERPLPAGRV